MIVVEFVFSVHDIELVLLLKLRDVDDELLIFYPV